MPKVSPKPPPEEVLSSMLPSAFGKHHENDFGLRPGLTLIARPQHLLPAFQPGALVRSSTDKREKPQIYINMPQIIKLPAHATSLHFRTPQLAVYMTVYSYYECIKSMSSLFFNHIFIAIKIAKRKKAQPKNIPRP